MGILQSTNAEITTNVLRWKSGVVVSKCACLTVRYIGGIEMGIGASIICVERLRDLSYWPAEEALQACQMWPNSRLPQR